MKKRYGNLKIRSKIMLGFCAVIVIMLLMTAYTLVGLRGIIHSHENLASGHFIRRDTRFDYRHAFESMQRHANAMLMYAGIGDRERVEWSAAMSEVAFRDAIESLAAYNRLVLSDDDIPQNEKDLRLATSGRVAGILEDYFTSVVLVVLEHALESDIAAGIHTIHGGQAISDYLDEVNAYLNNISDVWIAGIEEANIRNESMTYAIIVVLLAVIILAAIIITIVTATSISKPVRKLQNSLGKVAMGRFDISRDNTVSGDEIGQLTSDVYKLTDTIESLIGEFATQEHKINVDGEISYRIDGTAYSGTFKDFCEQANKLVENFCQDLFLVFDVLTAISDGNFNVKVRRLPGEKEVINRQFDAIVKNLSDIHGEIVRMFQNVADGVLDDQADVSKYKGVWAELLKDVNNLMSTVADPLSEIEVALSEMAVGNFETYVKGDYRGAFKALKQAVNSTGDDLISNVQEITSILQAIAKGDLTVPVDRSNINSYAPIKQALIDILRSLNGAVWTIQESATLVQVSAKQMAESASSLAEGTNTQAVAIQEVNSSLETINEKTRLNAEATDNANHRAIQSTDSAQTCSNDMREMVKVIGGIKDSSANISNITKVIENIAFQTNLLALNASIEAARAGAHGKGFTVVAEEVRSLAGRSQTSAKETTSEVSMSLAMVDEGMNAAHSTATSLDQIVNHVREVSTLIAQIADISKEQAEAVTHVHQKVNEISQVVQINSASSQESAAISHELSSQAETMKQAISFFKARPPREAFDKKRG